MRSMWDELDRQERELKIEQKHLSDIWLKVCEKHKKNEEDRAKLDGKKVQAGLTFVDPETPIKLNVGGQLFETTASVLCRDEYSVLAGICQGSGTDLTPRLPADEAGATAGAMYIDRDWWIFRHILQFLRTGSLPDDPMLIEELYNEATFYRLGMLRESIEKRRSAYHQRAACAQTRSSYYGTGENVLGDCGCGPCGGGPPGGCGSHGGRAIDLRSSMSAALPGGGGWGQSGTLPDPFGFSSGYGQGPPLARTW